jgi:hypothetical protein
MKPSLLELAEQFDVAARLDFTGTGLALAVGSPLAKEWAEEGRKKQRAAATLRASNKEQEQ